MKGARNHRRFGSCSWTGSEDRKVFGFRSSKNLWWRLELVSLGKHFSVIVQIYRGRALSFHQTRQIAELKEVAAFLKAVDAPRVRKGDLLSAKKAEELVAFWQIAVVQIVLLLPRVEEARIALDRVQLLEENWIDLYVAVAPVEEY